MKEDLQKLGKSLEYNNDSIVGWQDLKNKLDTILSSNNIMSSNDTINACKHLNNISHEERIAYIKEKWGPQYLEKSMPILILISQLD